jgi:hypothetical protein
MRCCVALPSAVTLILLFALACTSPAADCPDYLATVKEYGDAMIEHGRDRYGAEQSPLFAGALDRKELALLEGKAPSIPGIRSHDRAVSGSNPMHHQNLYQVLFALSMVTGEERYTEEADKALKWFFENCQSDVTGLMAWGEHMSWDFRTDSAFPADRMIHEYFRPWILMSRCFELAPEATERFARGVWEHQIRDHETGDFSRHARYDKHGPGGQNQYPRHGGFYIATWAEAYRQTEDPDFLKAIETVLGFYERHRSPESKAIPAEIGNKRSMGNMLWPSSNLSLAIDLWDAAAKTPKELGDRMRDMAKGIDGMFLKLRHEVDSHGQGFVTQGNVHKLTAEDVRKTGKRTHSKLWATGYGQSTDAAIANLCMLRWRQTGVDGYRDLILAAADRYVDAQPDTSVAIYPGTMGHVILAMIDAYELSGDKKYLSAAHRFARQSSELLMDDESPLPKASSKHHHYEAITLPDTLMLAFLKLWCMQEKPQVAAMLIPTDR